MISNEQRLAEIKERVLAATPEKWPAALNIQKADLEFITYVKPDFFWLWHRIQELEIACDRNWDLYVAESQRASRVRRWALAWKWLAKKHLRGRLYWAAVQEEVAHKLDDQVKELELLLEAKK